MLHANQGHEDGVSDPELLQSRGNGEGEGDRQASVFSMPQSWVYSYVQVKSDCRTLGMVVVPQGLHALSTCEPVKEKRIILSNFDL